MKLPMQSASNHLVRFFSVFLLATLSLCAIDNTTAKQDDKPFKNPGFEEVTDDDVAEHWSRPNVPGLVCKADTSEAKEGERSLLVDTTDATPTQQNFISVSQVFDAESYHGKKVRFRAFVKTTELTPGAQAQLWMRVDRSNEEPGGFDNMQNRPILNDDWNPYEIVLKVDDDAKQVVLGLIVIGKCRVRMDDVSLEVVTDDTETTDMRNETSNSSSDSDSKETTPARPAFSPILIKAMQEAENAPRQPFFNHWLWIPLLALVLFGLSGLPDKESEVIIEGNRSKEMASGGVAKFAFRFSFAYWLLYNGSFFISSIIPVYGSVVYGWVRTLLLTVSQWIGNNCFGIEGELVPPNGSGDTTQSFIIALFLFVVAILVALIWTVADRRTTNYRILKDLLRSYLRYILAFWMLSYGLAKVGLYGNQFSPLSEFQYNKFWGDSSPMNVVWAFMGASPAYTFFAGMGEVLGGLLLIWRRTAVLGALVVLGVMTNVMMLNYCYDVPVKLFSSHLVCMSLCILLFDLRRLANLLFLNRTVEPAMLRPPYTNDVTIWIQRAIKTAILVIAVAIPIYTHVSTQWKFYQQQNNLPEYFGQYEIVEYKLDGAQVDQSQSDRGWRSVRFGLDTGFGEEGIFLSRKMIVGMNKVRGRISATFTNDADPNTLVVSEVSGGLLPTDEILVTIVGEDEIRISGETSAGPLEVLLKRNDNIYRVTGRGYRWINEVPFNR